MPATPTRNKRLHQRSVARTDRSEAAPIQTALWHPTPRTTPATASDITFAPTVQTSRHGHGGATALRARYAATSV